MRRFFFLFISVLLLASACSSQTTVDTTAVSDAAEDVLDGDAGDPQDSAGTAAATAVPESDDEPEPADEPAPTAVPEPAEPPAADTALSSLGSDDWCAAAQQVEDNFDNIDAVNFGDPESLEAAYNQAYALISEAQRIAPPAIAGDVAMLTTGFQTFVVELERAEWNFLDVDLDVMEGIDEAMAPAVYNVDRYNFEVCGIDNGFDTSDDPALDVTDDTDDDFPVTGTAREQIVAGLVTSGFTQEQAECIANNLDIANLESLTDPSTMLDVFTTCGISLDQLGQLGG